MADEGRPRVDVTPDTLDLTPGEPFALELYVRNPASIIDGFRVVLIGLDQTSVRVEPEVLTLFPDTDSTITVEATLPREYPAGTGSLAVKVVSTIDPERFTVVELPARVAPRRGATLTIDPQVVTSGRRARLGVILENEGNTPLDVVLHGRDAEQHLAFDFTPRRVIVPPRETSLAKLTMEGRRPFIGSREPRAVTVYTSGDDEPLEAAATFVQKPWLARGAVTVIGMAAILGLWALVLVYGVDKIIDDTVEDPQILALRAENQNLQSMLDDSQRAAIKEQVNEINAAALLPGALSGTVMAASTGDLLNGVAVTVTNAEGDVVGVYTTFVEGLFLFTDLPPGEYTMEFVAAGFETAADIVAAITETDPTVLPVTLTGLPGSIGGTVSSSGIGRPGVSVSISGTQAQGTEPTPTGGAGEFAFLGLVTPGNYIVTFELDGFSTQRVEVQLGGENLTSTLEIELTAGDGSIAGRVLTAGDTDIGLGGVSVTAEGSTGGMASTTTLSSTDDAADEGTFLLTPLPSPADYTVTFSAPGYDSKTIRVSLTANDNKTLDDDIVLELDPETATGGIAGTVSRTGTGDLLPNVEISAHGPGDLTATTRSDENGDYAFTNLPTPGSYTLTFQLQGSVTKTTTVELPIGESLESFDIELDPSSGRLFGTTSDADGPLGGVTVVVAGGPGGGTTISSTKAGEVGQYELSSLVTPGTYSVTYSTDGYTSVTQQETIDEGESLERDVTLDAATALVFGKVDDASQTLGLGGATVTLSGESGSFATVTQIDPAVPAIVGEFTFGEVPTGDYTLQIVATGFVTLAKTIEVAPPSLDVGTLAISPGSTNTGGFSGKVTEVGASPNPLGGAVIVAQAGGQSYTTVSLTDPQTEGDYTMSSLPPGTYSVTVTLDGFASNTFEVVVAAGVQTIGVAIELDPNPGSIEGSVVNALTHQPLAGVDVVVTPTGVCPSSCSTTSAGGTFGIADLAAGSYSVAFAKTNFLPQTLSIVVEPGEASTIAVSLVELGTLSGTVTQTLNGGSLSGIQVTAVGPLPAATAFGPVTTSTGTSNYSIGGLVPGSYDVTYSHPANQWISQSKMINVLPGNSTQVNIAMESNVGTTGGAINQILSGPPQTLNHPFTVSVSAVSGPATLQPSYPNLAVNGSYALTGYPPGTYQLTFDDSTNQWLDAVQSVTVGPGSNATQSVVVLSNTGSISGSVVQGPSMPVAGIEVSIVGVSGPAALGPTSQTVTTQASGTFTLATAPPGEYDISFEGGVPWMAPATIMGWVVGPGASTTVPAQTVIPNTGEIAGTVTDANGGAPLANVKVTATGPLGYAETFTTPANGEFTFPDAPVGNYLLNYDDVSNAYLPATQGVTVLLGGTADGSIDLEPFATISGSVTCSVGGGAVANVQVTITGPSADMTTTSAAGMYGVLELNAGTYQVRFELTGVNTLTVNVVNLTAGNNTVQDASLVPTGIACP